MPVGSKIRKLRELNNYKREFVAEKLGMRDETDISLSRLEQIAAVFDMSVTEMLSWDEKFVFIIL